MGIVMLILGIRCPEDWKGSGIIIAISLIMAFEAIALAICNVVSKLNREVKNG
jgi:hypothetical protein